MLRSLIAVALFAAPLAAGPVLKIARTQVNIRADATVQSARVAVLQQGVEVEALGRKAEWFRIRLPLEGEGWIHSRYIRWLLKSTKQENTTMQSKPLIGAFWLMVTGKVHRVLDCS